MMTIEDLTSRSDYELYLLGTEPRRLDDAAARTNDPAARQEYQDRAALARQTADRAVEALVQRYYAALRDDLLRNLLRSPEQRRLANDAVMRAFFQLWRSDDVQPLPSLFGYLRICARCRACDLLRTELNLRAPRPPDDPGSGELPAPVPPPSRRRSRPVDPNTLEYLPAREESPLAILTAAEDTIEDPHLRALLDSLEPTHRRIVGWMYDGHGADEVLELLGWPPGDRPRLYRVLHSFRTRYLREHPERGRLVRAEIHRLRQQLGGDPELVAGIEQELDERCRPNDFVRFYRLVHRVRKRLGRKGRDNAVELDDLLTRLRLDAASPALADELHRELGRLDDCLDGNQRPGLEAIERELARRKLGDEHRARVGRELFRIRKALEAGRHGPASRALATLRLELQLHAGNDRLRATAQEVRDLVVGLLDGTRAGWARQLLRPLLRSPVPATWLRLLRLGKAAGRQKDLLAELERICRAGP
jgi:hypothetical protein